VHEKSVGELIPPPPSLLHREGGTGESGPQMVERVNEGDG